MELHCCGHRVPPLHFHSEKHHPGCPRFKIEASIVPIYLLSVARQSKRSQEKKLPYWLFLIPEVTAAPRLDLQCAKCLQGRAVYEEQNAEKKLTEGNCILRGGNNLFEEGLQVKHVFRFFCSVCFFCLQLECFVFPHISFSCFVSLVCVCLSLCSQSRGTVGAEHVCCSLAFLINQPFFPCKLWGYEWVGIPGAVWKQRLLLFTSERMCEQRRGERCNMFASPFTYVQCERKPQPTER